MFLPSTFKHIARSTNPSATLASEYWGMLVLSLRFEDQVVYPYHLSQQQRFMTRDEGRNAGPKIIMQPPVLVETEGASSEAFRIQIFRDCQTGKLIQKPRVLRKQSNISRDSTFVEIDPDSLTNMTSRPEKFLPVTPEDCRNGHGPAGASRPKIDDPP